MTDFKKLTKEELNQVVIYYYEENGKIHYINEKDEYGTFNNSREMKNYHFFQLLKGYEKNVESLKQFKKDFNKWRMNILASTKSFDYKQFYNHNAAVRSFYNIHCSPKVKKYNMDEITLTEYKYYEKCFNTGLTYINKDVIDEEIDCFGYDFKRYYPTILNSKTMKIPTKQGIEKKYTSLSSKLKYGIYNVKISCDNDEFNKMFSYSKFHHYTHFSLQFARDNALKYDISIELNMDEEFNALVYPKECLVSLNKIFCHWFGSLDYLKERFSDNKLIKHLFSSAWGEISKFNKVYKTIKEIEKENIIFMDGKDFLNGEPITNETHLFIEREFYDSGDIFILIPLNENPYRSNMRIKPFITAYGRNITASIMARDIDNVVRVHTDGVCFSKPQTFDDLEWFPVEEAKTTAKIIWYSTNTNNRNFIK